MDVLEVPVPVMGVDMEALLAILRGVINDTPGTHRALPPLIRFACACFVRASFAGLCGVLDGPADALRVALPLFLASGSGMNRAVC